MWKCMVNFAQQKSETFVSLRNKDNVFPPGIWPNFGASVSILDIFPCFPGMRTPKRDIFPRNIFWCSFLLIFSYYLSARSSLDNSSQLREVFVDNNLCSNFFIHWKSPHLYVQGDQLYMAVLFRCVSEVSSVHDDVRLRKEEGRLRKAACNLREDVNKK